MFHAFLTLIFAAQAQELPFAGGGRPDVTSIHAEISRTEALEDARAGLSVPFFKGEKQVWSAQLRGHSLRLDDTLVIPDRAFTLPKHFGGGDIGASVFFRGEAFQQGGNASVGSTGRKLFDDENARSVSLNYFARWAYENGQAIYFFLSYSNNRTRFNNIPLPGVAYGIEKPEYRLLAGFPFVSGGWNPRAWRLSAFASPFAASAHVGYVVKEPWQVGGGWAWLPRSFQNLAPDIDDERLIFDRKEWTAGVTYQPAPPISFSVNYVYQVDRRFFIGQSAGDRSSSAAGLPDEGGVQLKGRVSF